MPEKSESPKKQEYVIELVGRERGFVRSDPNAVRNLLNNAFIESGVSIAVTDDQETQQLYEKILSLLAYCGVTAITKNSIRKDNSVLVYDNFSSGASVRLDFTDQTAIPSDIRGASLEINASGPVQPSFVPKKTKDWDLGGLRKLGEPSITLTFKTVYPDGTNDISTFEFAPNGKSEFQHWRRDRKPMGYEQVDPTVAFETLRKLPLPKVDRESGNIIEGTPQVDSNTLKNYIDEVRDQRKNDETKDLAVTQVLKYKQYDACIYLPPFFIKDHCVNGRFISSKFPSSSFPKDALDKPSYLHFFDVIAKQRDVAVSPVRDIASIILFFTPGTFDHVIALGDIDGVEAPVDRQVRTNIADKASLVLLNNLGIVEKIKDLYAEFQQTLDEHSNKKGAGPEITSAIIGGLQGTDEFKEFKSLLFFITTEETPERERIAQRIYNELYKIGQAFKSNNIYTRNEETLLGLHPDVIEGKFKVVSHPEGVIRSHPW